MLSNKMDIYLRQRQEFDNFFSQFKLNKDDRETLQTHTCFGKPYGKYHIPEEKYNKFLMLYKKIACKKDNLHIIERHDGKNVGPFIIDIDYWVDGKHKGRKYRQDHIENLINISTNILRKYLKVKKSDLEVLVMEKEKPTYNEKKNRYKDGFHLVYPMGLTVKHRYFFSELIKKEAERKKLFDDIPFINENGYDEIFDLRVVYSNGLTMYGSRKEDGQTYYLTLIYDYQIQQQKLKYEPDELVVLCSLRRFSDEDGIELNDEYKDDEKTLSKIEEYSNKSNPKKKEKKNKKEKEVRDDSEDEDIEEDDDNENKKEKSTNKKKKKGGKKGEIQMAKKLLKILSKKRADIYSDWINVGWALHNVDNSLLDDYIEFSQQSSKWEEGCCEKIWDKAINYEDGLTIASLHWWAQNDNPEEYKKIMRESINKLIMDAETGTHDDIAKIVFELYKHKFRCTSIQKNIWYEFQEHRWVNVDSGYTLAIKLSDEITKEYTALASTYLAQSSVSDGHENENYVQKAKKAFSITEKLKNVSFKSQVLLACSHRFHEISKNFEELLDSNPNLIGFDNGVFDLEQGCFRPGLPDDYISMSTKYNYKQYKPNDQEIKLVEEYFNTVMIEEDMRKYVLKFISSCLDGHSRDQKFILWTGIGCHSKDTKILMYDGTIKKVQEIECGDKLMGDDGKPRTVKVLFTGEQDMYKIYLDNDEHFIVNKNHRLALKNKFKDNIYSGIDLYEQEIYWLEWYEYLENVPVKRKTAFISKEKANKYFDKEIKRKENYIHYDEVIPVMVNDYILLSDEVRNDFVMYSKAIEFNKNNKIDYYNHAVNIGYEKATSKLIKTKISDRLEYVAGLIDTYGEKENHMYKLPLFMFDNENVEAIVKSIGLKIKITGDQIYLYEGAIKDLTTKIRNPVKIIKDLLENNHQYNFDCEYKITKLEKLERNRFYGFEIDGDEKYMMGNFMATYNSNGKSTTVELMEKTMGEYFGVLPTTVLTRKRGSSSNATPELADKRGKRVLFIQEPEHDDTVYVGLMKNLTGGDWIEARALYGMPFRYKPQFKLVLVCNKLPYIPANDMGTWRRLRVTPWESKFIDGEPKKKNEFKKDKTLQEKLKKWKQAFAWLLLNKYYPDYKENGLEEPSKVTQFTDNYKKDQDIFAAYFGENIEITGESRHRMPLQTAYEGFKNYFKNSGCGGQIPGRKELEEYVKTLDKLNLKNGQIVGAREKEIEEIDELEEDVKKSKSSKMSVKKE